MTITEALNYTKRSLEELEDYNNAHRLPISRQNWEQYQKISFFTNQEMTRYFVIKEEYE